MSKKTEEEKGQVKGKVLTMPDQFQVVPLHHMMRKNFEEGIRHYCIERGLDPNDYMPEWGDE